MLFSSSAFKLEAELVYRSIFILSYSQMSMLLCNAYISKTEHKRQICFVPLIITISFEETLIKNQLI